MRTEIEEYVVNVVKEMRSIRGFSQSELAHLLEVSSGFIGKVESQKSNAKYNLNHINKLSIIFDCSPKDFLPNQSKNECREDYQ
jgi:transcriptional regulator with XRE-family HTH domain